MGEFHQGPWGGGTPYYSFPNQQFQITRWTGAPQYVTWNPWLPPTTSDLLLTTATPTPAEGDHPLLSSGSIAAGTAQTFQMLSCPESAWTQGFPGNTYPKGGGPLARPVDTTQCKPVDTTLFDSTLDDTGGYVLVSPGGTGAPQKCLTMAFDQVQGTPTLQMRASWTDPATDGCSLVTSGRPFSGQVGWVYPGVRVPPVGGFAIPATTNADGVANTVSVGSGDSDTGPLALAKFTTALDPSNNTVAFTLNPSCTNVGDTTPGTQCQFSSTWLYGNPLYDAFIFPACCADPTHEWCNVAPNQSISIPGAGAGGVPAPSGAWIPPTGGNCLTDMVLYRSLMNNADVQAWEAAVSNATGATKTAVGDDLETYADDHPIDAGSGESPYTDLVYDYMANPTSPYGTPGTQSLCTISDTTTDMCAPALGAACANVSRADLTQATPAAADLKRMCGCFMQNTGTNYPYGTLTGVQCDPACINAIPSSDTPCAATVCVMDGVSVNVIKSATGNITIKEVCGTESANPAVCYFTNDFINVIGSDTGKIDFSASCGTSTAFPNGNCQRLPPVPAGSPPDPTKATPLDCTTLQPIQGPTGTKCNPGYGLPPQGGACQQCTGNTVSPGGLGVVCTACPPGQVPDESHVSCHDPKVPAQCPVGQGVPTGGATCEPCPGGEYSAGGPGAVCTTCPPGNVPSSNQGHCVPSGAPPPPSPGPQEPLTKKWWFWAAVGGGVLLLLLLLLA